VTVKEEVWSDGDEDGQETWSGEINYVMGDVIHPQNTGTGDVIIVHCVGGCCVWWRIICLGWVDTIHCSNSYMCFMTRKEYVPTFA